MLVKTVKQKDLTDNWIFLNHNIDFVPKKCLKYLKHINNLKNDIFNRVSVVLLNKL